MFEVWTLIDRLSLVTNLSFNYKIVQTGDIFLDIFPVERLVLIRAQAYSLWRLSAEFKKDIFVTSDK